MRISPPFVAAVMAAALFVEPATGGVVIKMAQIGGNVVFSYSGSLDITGLTADSTGIGASSFITAKDAALGFGGFPADEYSGLSGPTSIGTGGSFVSSTLNTGDVFQFDRGVFDTFRVPGGYTSFTEISGSMTFDSQTFAALGIDAASAPYVWTVVGTGDTITLQAVPEPNSLAIFAAVGLFGAGIRRRRPSAKTRRPNRRKPLSTSPTFKHQDSKIV